MIFREINTVLKANLSATQRKIVLLSSLGSMHEYYDFIMFGFMAVYFAQNLLASSVEHNFASCIILAVFIFGYVFRPLGMFCYTKLYYRINRVYLLNRMTSLLIIVANLMIALIPNWENFTTLWVLIFARALQGFARGGEAQAEFGFLHVALRNKRGIAAFALIAGAEIGILVAILVNNGLNHLLTIAQMRTFGWRIPFLFGVGLSLAIYLIRYLFKVKKPLAKMVHMRPSWLIYRLYPRQMLFTSLLSGFRSSFGWLVLLLIPLVFYSRSNSNHIYVGHLMLYSAVGSLFSSFVIFHWVKISYSRIVLRYFIIAAIVALIGFAVAVSHNFYIGGSLLIVGIVSGGTAVLNMQVAFSCYPDSVRLSALSISYNWGHTIISGLILLLILSLATVFYHFGATNHPFHWWLLYNISIVLILMSILVLIVEAKLRNLKYYTESLNFIHKQ